MRPPRFAIAPQQRVIVRLDKDKCNGVVFLEVLQQFGQFLQLQTFASVYQQSRAGKIAFASRMELCKDGDEVHRKVVHAVEAHVLKGAQYGALTRTGEPSEDDELAGVLSLSRGRLHRKGLRSLRGVGACWECACPRDISPPCGA